MRDEIFNECIGIIAATTDHRSHQHADKMSGQGIFTCFEPMVVMISIRYSGNGIPMGLFPFGASDFKGAVASMIEAGMRMQDIKCPSPD